MRMIYVAVCMECGPVEESTDAKIVLEAMRKHKHLDVVFSSRTERSTRKKSERKSPTVR